MAERTGPSCDISKPPTGADEAWVFGFALTPKQWRKLLQHLEGVQSEEKGALWWIAAEVAGQLETAMQIEGETIGWYICDIDEHAPDYVKQTSEIPESLWRTYNPETEPKAQVLYFYTYKRFAAGRSPPTREQMDVLMEKLNLLEAGHPHLARWWTVATGEAAE